jgi:hypothetical protein
MNFLRPTDTTSLKLNMHIEGYVFYVARGVCEVLRTVPISDRRIRLRNSTTIQCETLLLRMYYVQLSLVMGFHRNQLLLQRFLQLSAQE